MTWQDSSPAAANGADASQTFNTTNISDMSVTGVMQQLTHPGLPTDGHEPEVEHRGDDGFCVKHQGACEQRQGGAASGRVERMGHYHQGVCGVEHSAADCAAYGVEHQQGYM